MTFCTSCGNQLNEGMDFCTKCGNAVAGTSANQANSPQKRVVNEHFSPTLGLGKSFAITENSLIYGSEEYPYSQLSTINLVSAPTIITDGVAQATVNGKVITLGYVNKDKERFASALTYANEQIDLAQGKTKNYKYILQTHTGSKVEVYEDYLILSQISTGSGGIMGKASDSVSGVSKGLGKLVGGIGNIGAQIGNATKGGATGEVIMFEELSVIQLNAEVLIIGEYSVPITPQNMELAKEIVAYIEETLKSEPADRATQPEEVETWEPVKTTAKSFPLSGNVLEIPENMDLFNAYRLKFRDFASRCADKAEAEYKSKVRDLTTFLKFFPEIYGYYSAPLYQKAMDILITEGIWSVTIDSLMEAHLEDFHLAFDDMEVIVESMALTVEANAESVSNVMSFIPNVAGFGFGIKGAAKGIAGAAVFNLVRDGIESSAMKNAMNISPAQQQELYSRINPENLFERVFIDYFNVFATFAWLLHNNGHSIWFPTEELTQQASNIFQNLSNPNFPQDKVLEVVLQILNTNPYDEEYYKFLISRLGETEEVKAIKDYFGYTEFDNPRII